MVKIPVFRRVEICLLMRSLLKISSVGYNFLRLQKHSIFALLKEQDVFSILVIYELSKPFSDLEMCVMVLTLSS